MTAPLASMSSPRVRRAWLALGAAALLLAFVVFRGWRVLTADAELQPFTTPAPGDLMLRRPLEFRPIWSGPRSAAPRGPTWHAESLTLPADQLALVEAHWRGWTIEAWDVTPPDSASFELQLFDARRSEAPLLEQPFPARTGAVSPLRLGAAYRLAWLERRGKPTRCAQFQLLQFDSTVVRVLKSLDWQGAWLPPPDEHAPPGWSKIHRSAYFGGAAAPVLAAWSWNGRLSAAIAANRLWPTRGQMHFTAVYEPRDEVASRNRLVDWPFPTLLLSVEPPDLLTSMTEPTGDRRR